METFSIPGSDIEITLSSAQPDRDTGLIADRIIDRLRVIELSITHPSHMSHWVGDLVVCHPQIAWKLKGGKLASVQGYNKGKEGPWKFDDKFMKDRVILWGDAAEVNDFPPPEWAEILY